MPTPIQESDLPVLVAQVLWAAFALSVLFGAVLQRTHFCAMGAVSDILTMGHWGRMRMWVVAAAVAMMGLNALVGLGWIDASKSIYTGERLRWLSHLLGGALFGLGMVLASGCGAKTLVRVGGGSLKALVVLLVMGFFAAMTMRGILAVARVATVDAVGWTLPASQDLPSLLAWATGVTKVTWVWTVGMGLGALLLAWALAREEGRRSEVWVAGLLVGLLVVGVWWVSGVWGHLGEHPQTLEEAFLATNSRRMESLSLVGPVAYLLDWLTFFSDKAQTLSLGVVSVLGIVVGSALMALGQGTFRWEGLSGTSDTAHHLVGAALMGVGGVMAVGCTVGQGLSGLSTLALGSFITVAGIVAGTVAGLRYQEFRLERMA